MKNPRYKRLGVALKKPAIAVQLSSLLLAGVCVMPAAQGATLVWNGNGADNNWSTAGNWNPSAVPANPTLPAAPDVIRFGGSTRLNPVVNAAATTNTTTWAVDAILFDAAASSFTLTGSAITFQPSNGADHDGRYFLKNNSGTTQTIDNDLIVKAAVPPGTTSGSGIHAGPAGGNLILNGNLDINGSSGVRFTSGVGTITLNGIVSGASGFLAVNDGATVVFNNTNTFTGGLTVWNGNAIIGANSLKDQNGALGKTGSVTVGHAGSPGTKILTRAAVTVGQDFATVKNTSNNAYTFGGDSAHISNFTGVIYNGALSGDANAIAVTAVAGGRANIETITRRSNALATSLDTVTKTGAGIVAMVGTSNYSGQTNVNAGTFLVNGTLTATAPNSASVGAVIVSTTAKLGGTGAINRAVTIQDGGIFAPGDINASNVDQGGKLTLGAGLTLNNASVLRFDLAGAGSTTDDEVSITGNLILDGQLNVTNLGGFGAGAYKLFDYTGTLTNNAVTFSTMPSGFTYAIDTASFANSVYLNVVAVPEPGMVSLVGIGFAFAFLRRRRVA